ncbi:sulfotransferase 1C2A [Caerostris darwini]|uniref:Sulfotransferase 1C2A n=1 Tax=Caerostris darwini TaxID=1538125 RepID=A0AAV4WPH2_9ARAC|nr:sulfotransferase 1C2A [Caerostris darwini]
MRLRRLKKQIPSVTMAETDSPTCSQFVDGFQIFGKLPVENFRAALQTSPYLEFVGVKGVEKMVRPGSIKIHLPFHLAPFSEEAKYIYVTRNPKDCCVSYYHHMKDVHQGFGFQGTFDEFFELFLEGKVDYGDYFDHLLGWYEHRNDPNVLFLTYEEMKADTEAVILRMASFVDEEKYAKPLREDPEKLSNVIKFSSVKHMREGFMKNFVGLLSQPMDELLNNPDIPEEFKNLFSTVAEMMKPTEGAENQPPPMMNFIRKGVVGDWKNYFSEDQRRRLDEKFAERTKGTDIANLFKDC